jgi:hypothetical protein
LVAAVLLTGALLVLGGVSCWRAGRMPVFRFLAGQQPVYHGHYRNGSVDYFSWPAEFESVAAQASKGLLQAGFVGRDTSPPGARDRWQEFSRPGLRRISVSVQRGKFVEGTGGNVRFNSHAPDWVLVGVRRSRFDPSTYLRYLWKRVTPPPPPPPQAKSTTPQ